MTHPERLAVAIANLEAIVGYPDPECPAEVVEKARLMLGEREIYDRIEAHRKQERENWQKEIQLLQNEILSLTGSGAAAETTI